MLYLLIGLAGSFGAILRYALGELFYNPDIIFPFPTLIANLLGSFVLAWFTTHIVWKFRLSDEVKAIIGTGFVGSFTTFSTLSVETVTLFQESHVFLAFLYIFSSIGGGLVMSRIGFRHRKLEPKR
ncbi:fluoride efflux transporter CrcB [Paenisporosarcina cavernae]|uniref:Fluoride-specific ion channel FluC n=1 Tax=Paenisporosarcina cavernae TaxID=2320858 RepID=A0A385YRV4_9BACL|nr:fluoride efflux transporter CrcB [Paenisporosarcina cavernae]AYC28478.1 fluoride efflux transporter CrcB [Paenisporosarcina cavernae]